jgi:hypothetical protein
MHSERKKERKSAKNNNLVDTSRKSMKPPKENWYEGKGRWVCTNVWYRVGKRDRK